MSFLKSVGIDVGLVAKGLSHKVSLANLRIDTLNAEGISFDPLSISNWGSCGCTSLHNVSGALNELARIRAFDIDDVNALDTRVTTLENSGGGGGLSNWSEDGNGSLLPNGNDTQDLGSASNKVRDLYLGPSSLKIVDTDDTTYTYNKDWFESRASKASLGNIDTRVNGLETLQAYTISTLPDSSNDGTQALVSDGADTGVALAYHYDRAWYRSFDNVVLADSKWSPADTNTQLWYDASDLDSLVVSGTDLTQWGDKSGNGYHLTRDQNASGDPQSGTVTLRGRNVIEFGTHDSMTNLDWSFDQNITALYIAFVWHAYVDGVQDFILHHTDSTAARQSLRRTTANGLQWLGSDTSGTSRNVSLNNIPEGGDNISSFKINGSSSWLGNYNATGREFNSGNTGNRPLAHISVGSNEIESSQLIGYFAEIVYYTDVNDVSKVEGYLAHKWGLSGYLTNDHAYKDSAP
jgi:hypothetical protein